MNYLTLVRWSRPLKDKCVKGSIIICNIFFQTSDVPSNSVSVSRSLYYSSPIPPFSSSFSLLLSFFFVLFSTAPTLDEANAQLHVPMSLSLNPKGPHTAPGAGREFWRPPVPLISPFPPILVPAFICYVEEFVFYYHLQSKHALCHPLSYLAMGSRDELGLEKHPQTASPYFPSPRSVPSLIYNRPTIAMINPGIPAFRKWVEDPQT